MDLLRYLGKDEEIVMLDPVQQLVRPSEEILELLKVDFRYVTAKGPRGFDSTIRQNFRKGELWHDLRDEFGVIWSMPDKQQLYMDMLENPSFCEALLDKILKYWLDYFTGFMKEIGDIIDVVMIGDDLAGQTGPLFQPEFYRSVVKPRQKKLVQHIKSLTSSPIWYHTCGSVVEYIPDLIDNGIDILNPVQITAQGMDPEFLKNSFGKELVFWGGGIDSQHVLPFATPDEVKANVKINMEAFKPGGGYVFNNVHNIQAGVPPENIIAMYEAAYEYGSY